MNEIQESAREMCNNEQDINTIAALTGLTVSMAKEAVQMISENPEISKQTIDFLESPQTSQDLKAYHAGLEEGKKSGFTRGVAISSVIALLSLVIRLLDKKDKQEETRNKDKQEKTKD